MIPSGFKVTLFVGLINAGTRWLLPKPGQPGQRLLPAERRRQSWKYWLHTLLLILCIVVYTLLSGGGPAALRAGVMGILLILAPRLRRFYNVYTAMALTALVMSLIDPFVIWDTGFQLSFIGTLGILLFTPLLQHLFRFLNRWPLGFHIAEIVAVTLAAQVATLPIFMLSFNQVSFIAPLANLASVPLLGISLALGALICVSGLIALPLALICGWLAWPLLWYVTTVITWCSHIPGAYLQVDNIPPLVAWIYYALLAGLAALFLAHWQPTTLQKHQHAPLLTRRTRLILQGSLALLMLLATGILTQATRPGEYLTIALLSNGDPSQGQALFLQTPDGQTVLIDEGASNTILSQTLDTRLPFWQRSLGLVLPSDTGTSNLAGLQDVVTRYQVQRAIDAGMLHPDLAYARWRNTLNTRNLPYTQTRQGALITLDPQTALQVLWPPVQLHKSSHETSDNALVLRLVTPHLRLLLLNSTALSDYALQHLPLGLAPTALQADIVQLLGEEGKSFPPSLINILTLAHPSLLLLTTLPARKHKNASQPATTTISSSPPAGPWEVLQNKQATSLEIQSTAHGWHINLSG